MNKSAGLLFFLAGLIMVMGIIMSEIFYPVEYNISQNMISNLGATRPPNSIVYQPSANIFDGVMIVSGVLVVFATYFLHMTYKSKLITAPSLLLGLGAMGVGFFPAYHALDHPISAAITFASGALLAMLASRKISSPFKYVSLLLGIFSLLMLIVGVVFPHEIVPVLGNGGTERFVAYPTILWLIGFGGYLMGTSKKG